MAKRNFTTRFLFITLLLFALVFTVAHNIFVLTFAFSDEYPIKTECSGYQSVLTCFLPTMHLALITFIVVLGIVGIAKKSYSISLAFLIFLWVSNVPKIFLLILNWAIDHTPAVMIMFMQLECCFENGRLAAMERSYHCCGVHSYADYLHSGQNISAACCNTQKKYCTLDEVHFKSGCMQALLNKHITTETFCIERVLYLVAELAWLISSIAGIFYFIELARYNKNMKEKRRLQKEEEEMILAMMQNRGSRRSQRAAPKQDQANQKSEPTRR